MKRSILITITLTVISLLVSCRKETSEIPMSNVQGVHQDKDTKDFGFLDSVKPFPKDASIISDEIINNRVRKICFTASLNSTANWLKDFEYRNETTDLTEMDPNPINYVRELQSKKGSNQPLFSTSTTRYRDTDKFYNIRISALAKEDDTVEVTVEGLW